MTSIKVPPEVKAFVEKLQLKNQQLTEENERLRRELDSIEKDRPTSRNIQTIEATGKLWKLLIITGGSGLIFAILGITIGINVENSTTTTFSIVVFVMSALLYGAGRLGKFWFHE